VVMPITRRLPNVIVAEAQAADVLRTQGSPRPTAARRNGERGTLGHARAGRRPRQHRTWGTRSRSTVGMWVKGGQACGPAVHEGLPQPYSVFAFVPFFVFFDMNGNFQAAIGTHYCGTAPLTMRCCPSRGTLMRCAEATGLLRRYAEIAI